MSGGGKDVREWDSSWPGTGAQRCTAITQLYFRLANYPSLTILVVDALCLVFGDSGATQSELEAYLGLSDERIRFALACIPDAMRCTSKDLPTLDGSSAGADKNGEEETELSHFLNYKQLLPLAYAHVTRVLLALSRTALPKPTASTQSSVVTASAAFNLSRRLVLENATEGIFCRACQHYHALADFQGTLAACPTCGDDVLASTIKVIKEKMDARCAQEKSLVALPPSRRTAAALASLQKKPGDVPGVGSPTTTMAASPTGNDGNTFPSKSGRDDLGCHCPLARDPFLVQQAVVFFYLYTDRFAFVSDAPVLVSPDDILSEAEYRRRLQGGSSVADRFRAAHRNPASIRVRLVSQKDVDAARTAENLRKLAKRANLPPWLRPRSATSLLGPNTFDGEGGQDTSDNTQEDNESPATGGTAPIVSTTAQTKTMAPSTSGPGTKRCHEQGDVAHNNNTDSDRAVAAFIAKEFFYDDFEPVPLPRRRLR